MEYDIGCVIEWKGSVEMSKCNLLVLFGGVSPEHEVSLRSAESILSNLDQTKYRVFPVGITKAGQWLYFASQDYSLLPAETWMNAPGCKPAVLSPAHDGGLLIMDGSSVQREKIDVVFPVLHGENGEDGSVQGLAQLANLPCVGPNVAASATSMDKCLTKLVADHAGVRQAAWELVTAQELTDGGEQAAKRVEARFSYPVFVKPAGTGSSVGVSKVRSRQELLSALQCAAKYDKKILVEEFIDGREVEVAVLGNDKPVASICGEIDSGVEFYDYDAKYITDTAQLYIPARIPEPASEEVRRVAVKIYSALGCSGLSRVDFFVTRKDNQVIFNEINTLPGFTSISMYPKLFAASGIPYSELLDRLIELAREARNG